jgi:hypothetical protein
MMLLCRKHDGLSTRTAPVYVCHLKSKYQDVFSVSMSQNISCGMQAYSMAAGCAGELARRVFCEPTDRR